MRALYWLLGAAVGIAGGALALDRRAKRRIFDEFLVAVRGGKFGNLSYQPAILPPGLRVGLFRGVLEGKPFIFVAKSDASGTRWVYALVWGDAKLGASWNPLSGESDHPLSQAYVLLRRRVSKDDGLSN